MTSNNGQMGMYKYISTATTTAVKATPGVLKRIILTETAAGTITINDGATAIGVMKASIVEGTYEFNVPFRTSLSIVTAAASKLTVVYE
jgi:hypothetical protein